MPRSINMWPALRPKAGPVGCSTDLMRPISFALFLPGGLWRLVNKRFHLALLPIGYRLRQHSRPANSSHVTEQTARLN